MYEIELTGETTRFLEADIEGSKNLLVKDGIYDPDPTCCTHFKAKLFLPKKLKKHIDELSEAKVFTHLPIDERSFDRSLPENERHLIVCKYSLANLRYLSGWKKNIAELGPEEMKFLINENPGFIEKTNLLLEEQKNLLHQSLSRNYQDILAPECEKIDAYGRCLLQEFAQEYLHYSQSEHADMQYKLACKMTSRNQVTDADLVIARQLYEKAAVHAHGEAEFALAQFHQNGIGGLTACKATARHFLDRAADHNVDEAKAARRLLTGTRKRLVNSFVKLMFPKK
ncbi:hypothetical protein GCM10022212_26960 [Actimicrobium antarcticum]|uniref:Sel1 repeat family protein n=2 Tax=Actimicrobium antarcticum TaxID=1051899 RepID=A0ABP7TKA6_9BURK